MKIPSREQAETFLAEAEGMNPGPWIAHSRVVARTAEALTMHLPGMDAEAAYVLGALHDIGRRYGVSRLRHTLDGYRFLQCQGFEDAARVCLTHSFPWQDIRAYCGPLDCPEDDVAFVKRYLAEVTYTPYDRLIQLCDAMCLPSGPCLIEKRMVDVYLRYGANEYMVPKLRAIFAIQREIETAMGCSIYALLPGVVANTFGFIPTNG